jgi:hypothetical protein
MDLPQLAATLPEGSQPWAAVTRVGSTLQPLVLLSCADLGGAGRGRPHGVVVD